MKKHLVKIPSLLLFFLFSGIFILYIKPSANTQILFWTRTRFVFLVILSICGTYLFISFFRPNLLKINNYLFYLAIVVLFVMETLIRINPKIVPVQLLLYLPEEVRGNIAEQKGLRAENMMEGKNLWFHYKPFQKLAAYPHVKIGSFGFRNPVHDSVELDFILLGDSIIISEAAKKDLGEYFRDEGLSCLNFAMGGYSPLHYRDVYKEIVLKRKIRHRFVLEFIFIGNDFEDVLKYDEVSKKGGDFRDYLTPEYPNVYGFLPWTLNIVRGIPDLAKNLISTKKNEIELPYRIIQTKHLWWPIEVSESSLNWELVSRSIQDIHDLTEEASSKLIVFLIPSPATLYSQYKPSFKKYDKYHKATSGLLRQFCLQKEIEYYDLNEPLEKEIRNKFLFMSDSDCHFNSDGVQTLYKIVMSKLKSYDNYIFHY